MPLTRYTAVMKKFLVFLSGFILVFQFILSASVFADMSVGLHRAACPATSIGTAHCYARITTDSTGKRLATVGYSKGLTPADLHDAYKLPAIPGGSFSWNGQTVAIVDANDNPKAAPDLTAYRKQFGLPLCGDGTANCILRKVNGNGSANLPVGNIAWGQEINLDVQMVAAICPACKILLVEASSASISNLGAAVDTAVNLGATVISNSYGGSEFPSEVSAQSHYNHPGIPITVASGDFGYGVEFPAASQFVTAVGGTTLSRTPGGRGWTETAWRGAGSGCSRYIPLLSWQVSIGTCKKRMVADVSAVADPLTGMAIYDSYGSTSRGNWYVFGGTSASAPLIAGIYALARATHGTNITYGEFPYSHSNSLFDIATGKTGSCSVSLKALCTSLPGYDGPTGLGTPNGIRAF